MAQNNLRTGSRGAEVIALQNHLNRTGPTGLPRLKEDGIFGPKTDARVKEFQRQKGLHCDGIVGPITEKTLIYSADRVSPLESSVLIAEWDARRLSGRFVNGIA